jgi:hypothetical protein
MPLLAAPFTSMMKLKTWGVNDPCRKLHAIRTLLLAAPSYLKMKLKTLRCKWSMQEAACHQDATVGSAFLFEDETEDIEV